MKIPAALRSPLAQAPLLGFAATLGFAPFFLWPLLLASVALLYCLINNATPRRAALLGLLWGFAHNLSALYWLPRAFYLDADRSVSAAIFGGIPALIGISLTASLFVVVIAYLTRRAPLAIRPFTFAILWVGFEVARSLTTLGFPWLPLGAAWGGSLPLMQSAALWGVHGLSLLLIIGALLVSNPTATRMRWASALLLALYGGGLYRLHNAPIQPENCTDQTPCIRMVQPNVQSAHKWNPAIRWAYLNDTLKLASANPTSSTTVIVMPETAVAFYLDEEPEVQAALAKLLGPGQTLLTGTVQRRPGQYFNGLVSVDKQGEYLNLLGWYNKRLLVPFGEYIPFRPLIEALPLPGPVRTMSQNRLDYTPGFAPPILATTIGNAVPLICYEGIFPYHVATAAPGARMLVNITNDNWFTGTTALAQHATLERLRAVETGLPLVRVANTGITFMVTPYGHINAALPINTATMLDTPLPEKLPPTPFLRLVNGLRAAFR
jgi:apolipoprotein N-acyltransferase